MTRSLINKYGNVNSLYFLLGLIAVYGMKHYYSMSTVESLVWVLKPTSLLTEWLTGVPFLFERGLGYVNENIKIAIAKPCAGLNFFMMLASMLSYTLIPLFRTNRQKCLLLVGVTFVTYALTLAANTLRIIVAMGLYKYDIEWGYFTAGRLHRMEGIVVYFLVLWMVYAVVQKIFLNEIKEQR